MGTCIILHLRSHMVTLIYRFPFSNYLREEIDERFDLLDLNRFGGLPGGPGAPFETRGRIFGILGLRMSFVRLTFEFSSSI